MQQDQASFCHLKGLLCTRNQLIALNKKKCYQNGSQTQKQTWFYCWIACLAGLLMIFLFTSGFYTECGGFCHVFACFCVQELVNFALVEQKELVRCHPQRQGSHITSGQSNGTSPFLQIYHQCIPVSCQAKIYGKNCSTKGTEQKVLTLSTCLLNAWQSSTISLVWQP